MPKGIFYVFAFVSDLARSKRFYGETLGWQLGTDEHGVAGFSFGTGYFIIHEDSRPTGMRTYGGGMHVAVQVDPEESEFDDPDVARRYIAQYLGDEKIRIYWGSVGDFVAELDRRRAPRAADVPALGGPMPGVVVPAGS